MTVQKGKVPKEQDTTGKQKKILDGGISIRKPEILTTFDLTHKNTIGSRNEKQLQPH